MIDPHLQPPETRIQFVFAKVSLTEAQLAQAEDLARQITDWDGVLRTAGRNFNVPNMRMHVQRMAPDSVPEDLRRRLDEVANVNAVRNMRLVAEQRRFLQKQMRPVGAEGIFFKGINLVAQYYPELGLRPCRDIDILVRPGDLAPVVKRAVAAGYSYVLGASRTYLTTERDIDIALEHCRDATLVSPDDIIIDLQIDIDKHSGIFSKVDFFGLAEPMSLGGEDFLTFPPALLFNYLCHHHSRHVWSHLHWLSDLDAVVSSAGFDPAAALALADELGQRGTVEAGLQLQRLMDPGASWAPDPARAHGLQFLKLCLSNLQGDMELEKRIALEMIGGEFMYPWQARPDLLRKARFRRLLHVLQPTIEQRIRHPLPAWLQWLYVVPRAVELVGLTLSRARRPVP